MLIRNSEHCLVASVGATALESPPHTLRDGSITQDAGSGAAEAILPAVLSTLLTFYSLGGPFSDEVLDSGPPNSRRKDPPRCRSR
jgi:hypothetical protein